MCGEIKGSGSFICDVIWMDIFFWYSVDIGYIFLCKDDVNLFYCDFGGIDFFFFYFS